MNYSKETLREMLTATLKTQFGCTPEEATDQQMYGAVLTMIQQILLRKRADYLDHLRQTQPKRIYYMSMEFLVGRSLRNNLYNLTLESDMKSILTDFGFDRPMYVFARDGFAPFRDEYKAACINIGRRVTFDLPGGGQGAGEAIDVDADGRLVVRTDSGEEHVFTGEVSVHGIYGAV